ncbi:hypothetical protein ACFX12_025619 [Malus domestica]
MEAKVRALETGFGGDRTFFSAAKKDQGKFFMVNSIQPRPYHKSKIETPIEPRTEGRRHRQNPRTNQDESDRPTFQNKPDRPSKCSTLAEKSDDIVSDVAAIEP